MSNVVGLSLSSLNLCRSNHSARDTRTSIAGGLAELVAAHSQVIGISVHDQGATHNVIRARQRDLRVANVYLKTAKVLNLNRSSLRREKRK